MNDKFVQYVEVDDTPINFRKLTKQVSVNGEWELKTFYELKLFRKEHMDASSWLEEHYGRAQYTKTWWGTFTSIVMSDTIYTHWKLCNE